MKNSFIKRILILFICCISFFSCEKLFNDVDITMLPGDWELTYDNPYYESAESVVYSFDDYNTCYISLYDAYTDTEVMSRFTYEISADNRIINLYHKSSGIFYDQFEIRRLTTNELWLKPTTAGGTTLYFSFID